LPFSTPLAVAIYLTMWWIVLFAVLPIGVRSQHEEAEPAAEGSDPGAPVAPRLLVKAAITTVVSAILFGALVLYMKFLA
jgi:predicted secreted protein